MNLKFYIYIVIQHSPPHPTVVGCGLSKSMGEAILGIGILKDSLGFEKLQTVNVSSRTYTCYGGGSTYYPVTQTYTDTITPSIFITNHIWLRAIFPEVKITVSDIMTTDQSSSRFTCIYKIGSYSISGVSSTGLGYIESGGSTELIIPENIFYFPQNDSTEISACTIEISSVSLYFNFSSPAFNIDIDEMK